MCGHSLVQTMLIMNWRMLWSSLCTVEHAESLNVESTHAPHEGFLHRFLIALSLLSQSLNLCLGFLYSLTVLQRQVAEYRRNQSFIRLYNTDT